MSRTTLIIPTELLTPQIINDKTAIIKHCKKFDVDVIFGTPVKPNYEPSGGSIFEKIFESIFK